MEKVLISACLIGDNTKYDGKNNYTPEVEKLFSLCDLVIVCPEVMGGLSIPRQPSEIKNGKVVDRREKDVTRFFESGANLALHIARENGVRYAVLKENSPSCGHRKVYDGTFSSRLIEGKGIAASLLEKNGIRIFSEREIDELISLLK